MINLVLSNCQQVHDNTGLPWRQLPVAYSTLMRWRRRKKAGLPLIQKPGPKKFRPIQWQELYSRVLQLKAGRVRTAGTTLLYEELKQGVSRRELSKAVARARQEKLSAMKRIDWHQANLAWSIDSTAVDWQGRRLTMIVVQDLASRYRMVPLILPQGESGEQIAVYLEKLFKQHRAPLLLKRDNGWAFNCQLLNHVLNRYGVLALNSPPYYPAYNGAMERSIGELKAKLYGGGENNPQKLHGLEHQNLQALIHQLNHAPRRCLKGLTPCQVYHDTARGLRLTKRQRNEILRLLYSQYA